MTVFIAMFMSIVGSFLVLILVAVARELRVIPPEFYFGLPERPEQKSPTLEELHIFHARLDAVSARLDSVEGKTSDRHTRSA